MHTIKLTRGTTTQVYGSYEDKAEAMRIAVTLSEGGYWVVAVE